MSFYKPLARPAAAAAATYAGEKLVSKMFDEEEEVDEQTGASSSGAFVAPLGWDNKQGLEELEIKLPLSGNISLGGDVDFSALSDNPGG